MGTSHTSYASFLVRLWREPPTADNPLAVSVQVAYISGDERRYFASLEELCAYFHDFVAGMAAGERNEVRGLEEACPKGGSNVEN
jgi:hypothetical protein